MLYTMQINGAQIAFDDRGHSPEKPALVLVNGWGGDHRYFERMLPQLVSKHRVIRANWRGHGPDRTPIGDYGTEELVADTIALLDALEVDRFVPVSISHGGWAVLDIADELGAERVPQVMLVDQIMTSAPPEFVEQLHAMQRRETWREARDAIFAQWAAGGSDPELQSLWLNAMGGHGFGTWSRACFAIEKAYDTWGSPMGRMEKISQSRPIRHIFSHPKDPEYDKVHEEFATKHSWFSWSRLNGATHFPTVELPDTVCRELGHLLEE